MSDMSASIVLRLVDDITGPAKKAAESVRALIRETERFQKLAGKKSSDRSLSKMAREIKSATQASRSLHQSLSKPIRNSFAQATSGISRVRREANEATRAVSALEGRLRQGGSFRTRESGGIGGVINDSNHTKAHGSVGGLVKSAAIHTLVYEGISTAIEGARETMKTGLEQAFELQHTKVMLAMQGEQKGQIDDAVAKARSMTKSLPQFTTAQNLEAIAELRPALLGGLKEAIDLGPMFQKSISVLEAVKQGAGKKALGGIDTHGEALDLVRALEVKGVTAQGDKAMDSYVNGITKAIVAFNGQIGAKDFHSAFKFSRGDSVNWSQQFSTEILPTLMNELKKSSKTDASQTGNALKSMSRVVMDGIMTPDALAKWNGLGMLTPGAFKAGKGGKMSKNGNFHGAAMLGGEIWQDNPYQWVQDYLLPHMKSKGIDLGNRKQVVEALGGLFGNRVANHIAQILATQQAIIQKDADNVRKAQGTSGLDFLMNADPVARMQTLSAAFKDLSGAFGDAALPASMRAMKGAIDEMHAATDWLNNSAGVKRASSALEAMTGGFFGQGVGNLNREFYADGQAIRQAASSIKDAIAQLAADLVPPGDLHENIQGLSSTIKQVVDAMRLADNPTKLLDQFTQPETYKDAKAQQDAGAKAAQASAQAPAAAKAMKQVQDVHDRANKLTKLPPMVRAGSKLGSIISPSPFGALATAPKVAFGLGGPENMGSGLIQPIASAVSSAAPIFASAGSQAMNGLASGLASGSGQAKTQVISLMGELAAIAAAGITIPIHADASGVADVVRGAMRDAASGAQKQARAQFSKSLSDGVA